MTKEKFYAQSKVGLIRQQAGMFKTWAKPLFAVAGWSVEDVALMVDMSHSALNSVLIDENKDIDVSVFFQILQLFQAQIDEGNLSLLVPVVLFRLLDSSFYLSPNENQILDETKRESESSCYLKSEAEFFEFLLEKWNALDKETNSLGTRFASYYCSGWYHRIYKVGEAMETPKYGLYTGFVKCGDGFIARPILKSLGELDLIFALLNSKVLTMPQFRQFEYFEKIAPRVIHRFTCWVNFQKDPTSIDKRRAYYNSDLNEGWESDKQGFSKTPLSDKQLSDGIQAAREYIPLFLKQTALALITSTKSEERKSFDLAEILQSKEIVSLEKEEDEENTDEDYED